MRSCWVDHEWSSDPSHCASVSGVCPSAGLVVLICQGYCRPDPFGWLNTEWPPDSSMVARSAKPRTPLSVP